MRNSRETFGKIYPSLVFLRICLALLGSGYIHPDEHFQNAEVVSSDVLGLHALRTWEWNVAFPVRSVVPPFVTTGLSFWILNLFCEGDAYANLEPSVLFWIERAMFLTLSFLLDLSITALVPQRVSRRVSLLILATSHVLHTFQLRPFSNSLESVFVAICLVLLHKLSDKPTTLSPSELCSQSKYLNIFAAIFVFGIFTRVTFVAFGFPMVCTILARTLQQGAQNRTNPLLHLIRVLSFPALIGALTAIAFITCDTLYFRGSPSNLVITPWNFLSYNTSSGNLAEHGLHPRWLHLFVNLPLIVGPGLIWLGTLAVYECIGSSGQQGNKPSYDTTKTMNRTIVGMIVMSLSILSMQPHQEPRFLTPLLLPLIVLIANTGKLSNLGRIFWIQWIAINAILALVFGCLHQGGVVPSLMHLHSRVLYATPSHTVGIVYWKTYMPPWHLLGIKDQVFKSGSITLTDLAGASEDNFIASLNKMKHDIAFIVTPMAMHSSLPDQIGDCLSLDHRIFPHLDLDHIPESIQAGWTDELTLGIYTLDLACLPAIEIS